MFLNRRARVLGKKFRKPPALTYYQADSTRTNYHLEDATNTPQVPVVPTEETDDQSSVSTMGNESVKQNETFDDTPFVPPQEISFQVKTRITPEPDPIIQPESKSSRRFGFLLRRQTSFGSRIECQDTIDALTGIKSTKIRYIKRKESVSSFGSQEERTSYYTGPTDVLSDSSSNFRISNGAPTRTRRRRFLRSEMKNIFRKNDGFQRKEKPAVPNGKPNDHGFLA